MSARIWVTGVGLVTALGSGVDATWERLVRGDRAIRPIRLFDPRRPTVAGEVDGAVPPPGAGKRWSRTSAMAWAAAREAMRAAGIGGAGAASMGLAIGGTTGGMFESEQALARLHGEPHGRETPELLSQPLSTIGDSIEESLGPFCRVRTLASACSSGANAIVAAASWLLADEVDIAVAGGADGLCRLTVSGFNALGALDPQPCRPFDLRRRGTNLGEGAAFLVLERADRARVRGRRPIAELAGWALGSEAYHITHPAPGGALVASLIERAITRAGLRPSDIDYINAHGTGTPLNDAMEAAALHRALGREMARIPVSSSKGQIGHALGGAGAIEAAITSLVIDRHTLVPTAGLEQPDPELSLVHVTPIGRSVARVRATLSNAFGFGGMDTVLVFTEPDYGSRGEFPAFRAAKKEAPEQVITGAAVFGSFGRLDVESCADLPQRSFSRGRPADPDAYLDAAKARRLDRAARLAAVAAEDALAVAGAPAHATGILLGSAYGNVDGSAAFIHRVLANGPRAASPADFPNLVPSSPVGHVTIYLGLVGPAFMVADLGVSGESAFVQAAQLVAAGESERVVAGAVEPQSNIVDRVLSDLFAPRPTVRAAGEDLAAAVVVESESGARSRRQPVLARIRQRLEWRGDPQPAFAALEEPGDIARAEVVVARADSEAGQWLARTSWRECPRIDCAGVLGESDALGAVAICVAVGRIATGRVQRALVLGLARGRGFAIVLSQ